MAEGVIYVKGKKKFKLSYLILTSNRVAIRENLKENSFKKFIYVVSSQKHSSLKNCNVKYFDQYINLSIKKAYDQDLKVVPACKWVEWNSFV